MRNQKGQALQWKFKVLIYIVVFCWISHGETVDVGLKNSEANVNLTSGDDQLNTSHGRRNSIEKTKLNKKQTKVQVKPFMGFLPSPLYDLGDLAGFEKHPCRRVCQRGQSLTCYYKLVLHNYQRLGPECQRCQYDVNACEMEHCIYGDGVPSPVMAVNRMVPGPSIEVCQNDTVIVDVVNYLSEPTTIHWHGVHMSQSPEADGAPFITQYPVNPGEAFRYQYETTERSGTLWWHSHVGWQRALGVAGNLVIRNARQENPQSNLYDFDLIEHTLLIQDIVYKNNFDRPTNILINGKGRNHLTTLPDNDARHRYERLRVSPNSRYRMRVILNGVFDCPIEFSIENHKLLIISTDGNDIEPIWADSFFMGSAERFDFILHANQYVGNYWIRVRGYNTCGNENLYQGAVLHYRGATRNEQPVVPLLAKIQTSEKLVSQENVIINYLETFGASNLTKDNSANTANIATAALRSLALLSWPKYTKFLTYYSSFGSRTTNGNTIFQIDDITYFQPDLSLLQARYLYREDNYFCNRSEMQAAGFDCVRDNCACTNVIRLPAYKPLEIVVANYLDSPHPFHIHGYTFRVVGQGVIGSISELRRIRDLDSRGKLQRVPDDFPAVQKDTIQIPGRGYIIIRFLSNNPGFWMYHCHIELHALQGMVAVLKIGELNQIKRTPPKIRC